MPRLVQAASIRDPTRPQHQTKRHWSPLNNRGICQQHLEACRHFVYSLGPSFSVRKTCLPPPIWQRYNRENKDGRTNNLNVCISPSLEFASERREPHCSVSWRSSRGSSAGPLNSDGHLFRDFEGESHLRSYLGEGIHLTYKPHHPDPSVPLKLLLSVIYTYIVNLGCKQNRYAAMEGVQ